MRRLKSLLLTTLLLPSSLFCQGISFSVVSGFYAASFELSLSTNTNFDIRYTLDGSDPDGSSALYENPIVIDEKSQLPSVLSNIPTNPPSTPAHFRWYAPQLPVLKTTMVKAALFENGNRMTLITAHEYFIGGEMMDINLPVVSIQADSSGFFGYEEGIYVPGKDYDNNPDIWHPGNYYEKGNEWERNASIGFYEGGDLIFRQNVEVEIHGDGSRIMPCKSLRLSAKKSLGNKYFDHPFFENREWGRYKRLILRNAGQDFVRTLFADVLMQTLLADTNVETQASRQTVVFINGEYWGIHNLRERYDKYFLENYHQGGLEDFDLVETSTSHFDTQGSSSGDYKTLIESLLDADLSNQANFGEIALQIDLDSYIDHHISKVYGGGEDWGSNNEKVWRPHTASALWRWLANDYDDAFVNFEKDAYKHATNDVGTSWPNPEWSTRLFRSLMTNKGFARRYKTKLRYHLDYTFHPDRVIRAIDSIAQIYLTEMPRHIARWNYPSSISAWEEHISDFKIFAQKRPIVVWQNFLEYFPDIYLPPEEVIIYPNPASSFLNIDLPKDWSGKTQYSIYSSNGQLVQFGDLTNEQQNYIELNNFQTGLYFIWINGAVGKIINTLLVR